ncbi:MAG: carbohydrate kinase family protein [bacterium]|nr:carbohydrate kinase family protein [bacterium]
MDFLAIGDTVVDTFIKLKDAEVHCDIDNEHCTICMRFADKIPFESATVVPAVGNAANAAVAAARLGLKTAFIAGVGKDRDGADCIAQFKKENISTDFITVKDGESTVNNYVLWYGNERTILVKYAHFHYELPAEMPSPRIVYLSAIGETNVALHDPIADWLEKNPKIRLAFQPGTFQISAGFKRLERIYKRSDILFANKEEYQRILGTAEEDIKKLMEIMHTKGPKTCVLTNGPEGAYSFDGNQALKIPAYPDPKPPYERTGAGDAFSSTVAVALTLGKPLAEALTWGPINSMAVVQYIGAQQGLLSRKILEGYVEMAPEGYRATPL